MVPASLQEDSEKLQLPEPTQSGISSLIFSSETEIKLFTSPHFWFPITDTLWTIRLSSEPARVFWARALKPFWISSELQTMEQLWPWVWNKNFSLFQRKPMSRDLISDQPEELYADNFHPSINNSLTITMARFPTKSKTSWKKLKTNFWNSESQ